MTLETLRRAAWHLAFLALLAAVSGCGTVRFYAQAAKGQWQILHRQKPIESVLADTNTPPDLRERLQRVLAIRGFAEKELKLPANGHYLRYADLGRRYAVWNVYAAPEFSVEARSWWYPVVGRLKYRGYFSERSARRLAAQLALRGYDVHVGGVTAYSTLGWFRDPVLNTFVFDADLELADLLFHELTHQRLFVPGDTDFNEALATAVAEEGVRRWLRAEGRGRELTAYEEDVRRKHEFVGLLSQARDRLQEAYTNGLAVDGPGAAGRRRAAKQAVFQELGEDYARWKASWGGRQDYDGWFHHPLNNARLNTVESYYRLVPAFHRLLARCDGNLERFFAETERLAKEESKIDRRRARLEGAGP